MQHSRLWLALVLIMWVVAAPGWSYVVVLKDGKQITTASKYELEGDLVLLTMPSGTTTSYAAAEVDFAATEQLNSSGELSNVTVLRDGEAEGPKNDPPPDDGQTTFDELISEREVGLALPEVSLRPTETEIDTLVKTGAGFVDLEALPRQTYTDYEISSEVMGCLQGQGNEDVRIFAGRSADQPLVEVVTQSEASVFKALTDSANCLVQIHQRNPQKVAAFDLLLVTERQVRAGQFELTPELANLLVTGRLQPASFFLRYVEF